MGSGVTRWLTGVLGSRAILVGWFLRVARIERCVGDETFDLRKTSKDPVHRKSVFAFPTTSGHEPTSIWMNRRQRDRDGERLVEG
jgi:hypothetical protein